MNIIRKLQKIWEARTTNSPYAHPLQGILITVASVCAFLVFLVLVTGFIKLVV